VLLLFNLMRVALMIVSSQVTGFDVNSPTVVVVSFPTVQGSAQSLDSLVTCADFKVGRELSPVLPYE
jgi:phage protein U